MQENIDEVRRHYDEDPKKEWDRMKKNPFEFWITTAWMDRYLKEGDEILDVGGGPGRYSIHYALKNHRVLIGRQAIVLIDVTGAVVGEVRRSADEELLVIEGRAFFARPDIERDGEAP